MYHKRIILFVVFSVVISFAGRAQVTTSLTPNYATPGKTLNVLIRGMATHFQSGVTTVDLGPDIIERKICS